MAETRQDKIDRLSRQILALLHKNPTGPLLGKLNKLLVERAALEREKTEISQVK
jgi:hypothetical protein